ncbi:hypothetical protein BKA70DRAFT_1222903 [Coprinopsis sp. MPI-PUGE-AT-0042]|nr:hypothetical protein BKA70DRAFT_1222903 [Coprinopsis sp. MPI-PUGE-AT-0042]
MGLPKPRFLRNPRNDWPLFIPPNSSNTDDKYQSLWVEVIQPYQDVFGSSSEELMRLPPTTCSWKRRYKLKDSGKRSVAIRLPEVIDDAQLAPVKHRALLCCAQPAAFNGALLLRDRAPMRAMSPLAIDELGLGSRCRRSSTGIQATAELPPEAVNSNLCCRAFPSIIKGSIIIKRQGRSVKAAIEIVAKATFGLCDHDVVPRHQELLVGVTWRYTTIPASTSAPSFSATSLPVASSSPSSSNVWGISPGFKSKDPSLLLSDPSSDLMPSSSGPTSKLTLSSVVGCLHNDLPPGTKLNEEPSLMLPSSPRSSITLFEVLDWGLIDKKLKSAERRFPLFSVLVPPSASCFIMSKSTATSKVSTADSKADPNAVPSEDLLDAMRSWHAIVKEAPFKIPQYAAKRTEIANATALVKRHAKKDKCLYEAHLSSAFSKWSRELKRRPQYKEDPKTIDMKFFNDEVFKAPPNGLIFKIKWSKVKKRAPQPAQIETQADDGDEEGKSDENESKKATSSRGNGRKVPQKDDENIDVGVEAGKYKGSKKSKKPRAEVEKEKEKEKERERENEKGKGKEKEKEKKAKGSNEAEEEDEGNVDTTSTKQRLGDDGEDLGVEQEVGEDSERGQKISRKGKEVEKKEVSRKRKKDAMDTEAPETPEGGVGESTKGLIEKIKQGAPRKKRREETPIEVLQCKQCFAQGTRCFRSGLLACQECRRLHRQCDYSATAAPVPSGTLPPANAVHGRNDLTREVSFIFLMCHAYPELEQLASDDDPPFNLHLPPPPGSYDGTDNLNDSFGLPRIPTFQRVPPAQDRDYSTASITADLAKLSVGQSKQQVILNELYATIGVVVNDVAQRDGLCSLVNQLKRRADGLQEQNRVLGEELRVYRQDLSRLRQEHDSAVMMLYQQVEAVRSNVTVLNNVLNANASNNVAIPNNTVVPNNSFVPNNSGFGPTNPPAPPVQSTAPAPSTTTEMAKHTQVPTLQNGAFTTHPQPPPAITGSSLTEGFHANGGTSSDGMSAGAAQSLTTVSVQHPQPPENSLTAYEIDLFNQSAYGQLESGSMSGGGQGSLSANRRFTDRSKAPLEGEGVFKQQVMQPLAEQIISAVPFVPQNFIGRPSMSPATPQMHSPASAEPAEE